MPYWRLSAFYFFYFSALGVLAPFWALYLKDSGYTAIQIGELMAIPMATKMIAPFVWGVIADHTNKRMQIVRSGALAAFLTFLLVFWVSGFWPLAIAMTLFSFFWNAVLPQVEAVTFRHLDQESAMYSRVRVWGSIGFIAMVVGVGYLIDHHGSRVILYTLAVLYAGIWVATQLVPEESTPAEHEHQHQPRSFFSLLKSPPILTFVAACFLMQFSHGAYYTFYTIYMQGFGYSETLIGEMWALGVIAEVVLYIFFMHKLLERFGARTLLIASLAIAGLRWLLIGHFGDSLAILLFAQLLHAATFGSFHAAAIHYVHHAFTHKLQGRGQALYSSISFGAGGAAGSVASGATWELWGATTVFSIAAVIAFSGMLITIIGMDRRGG
ncbi:MFS transporter [Solemya velum gill symbiont]|uniref:MFS transporter n=1 Tax=Solemya velum gill symbiont TaxID=2340 RepID=UPI000998DDB0|nr:MFS transporter [Solemya velum gill symbiont]OOZ17988.1 MFS transporter [Solemya velum gill symbiont]OOZ26625.1 MFS transporter [Solemya velum gill symbiont]